MTEKQFLNELEKRNIYYFRSGDNIMLNCIFHNEKNPSMGVNFRKKVFQCFSCGVTGIVKDLENEIFEGKSDLIIEDSFDESRIEMSDRLRKKLKKIKNGDLKTLKIKILVNFNFDKYPSIREGNLKYSNYLYLRGINSESWKKFNIRCGYFKKDERIIIPMYDEFKRLIAVYGRSINNNNYLRIRKSKNSDVGKILFGLEHIKKRKDVAVLVEGEFDAIYLQQFKIPAVSLGSKRPTTIQLLKMVSCFRKVYLSLDGDVPNRSCKKKGIIGINEVARVIAEYLPLSIIRLPKNKDPNSLDEKEVYEIYKELI